MSPSACGLGGAARLAVQAYIEGELLCDAGNVKQGVRKLRRAIDAEPALDNDDWPSWATELRAGLEHAAENPPALATADVDLNGGALSAEQAAKCAAAYCKRHFVILDGVTSELLRQSAHDEMACEDAQGRLELSTVYASPSSQAVSVAVPERRSDRIQYLDLAADADAETPRWSAVQKAVACMDAVVRGIREHAPHELGDIAARQRPMVSAYTEGARFERHCDNHCHDEDEYDPEFGHCANRRRLSAVLYCVPPSWAPAHGGALRLYRPTGETGGWDGDDALCDVTPVPGRLILFASDQRVPHEVLPVHAAGVTRYALALWYLAPADAGAEHVVGAGVGAIDVGREAVEEEKHELAIGDKGRRDERESDTSVISTLREF